MPLNLQKKEEIVSEVKKIAEDAVSVIAADYRGITSADMTRLRAQARQCGVTLKVVRNTLARRAFEGTSYDSMRESLIGPVLLVFATDEPGASARVVRDFAKGNENLTVKAISLEGDSYEPANLEIVASLPTKSEAISQLLSVMKAPITKLAQTLQAPHLKLVRTIDAVRDKKENE